MLTIVGYLNLIMFSLSLSVMLSHSVNLFCDITKTMAEFFKFVCCWCDVDNLLRVFVFPFLFYPLLGECPILAEGSNAENANDFCEHLVF